MGCCINLGIYDLLICTSLKSELKRCEVTQLSPPRSNLAAENNWEALHFFFLSSLTAGKCSLHYSSECSWGTGAVETEWGGRRASRRMQGERKRGEGHAQPSHKKVCYSSEGFIFVLHYTVMPHFSTYCSRQENLLHMKECEKKQCLWTFPPPVPPLLSFYKIPTRLRNISHNLSLALIDSHLI